MSSDVATGDRRVTARIYRDAAGNVHTEYLVDGVGYGSADALEAALRHT